MVILALKLTVLARRIEWYAFPSIWYLFKASRAVTSWKSRIFDTFCVFLGHFVSFGGRRVVILSLKMSVLKRRIEWYAFPSIWNLFKPSRAVTSWKSWILDTFCVFLGSLGGFRGVLAWSYWILKWASWRDESNGMHLAPVGPIGKKLEPIFRKINLLDNFFVLFFGHISKS